MRVEVALRARDGTRVAQRAVGDAGRAALLHRLRV
jgi:hypothetical protein